MWALLGLALLLGRPGVLSAQERTTVAILPVVIHSMTDQEFLRSGLGDMLVSRLGRDPRIAPLALRDVSQATTDLEAARATARGVGASYVVYGSFTHFGEGASLDLVCASVNGDDHGPREVFVHAGKLGEIIPTLDGLADRVARYVIEGPSARAPAETASGDNPAPGDSLEDLRRRVEALEAALGSGVATEEEIDVPGIFEVYPEPGDESAQTDVR